VFYAGIHRDEITPHLYAYVVPRDGERLNCRKWLGGSKALSQMQTEFAETIGRPHGLERGIERSRARHVSIREFYSRINAPTPDISRVADLPQPRMLETKRRYGERVYDHVKETVGPALRSVSAKLTQAELVTRDVQGLKQAVDDSRKAVASAQLRTTSTRTSIADRNPALDRFAVRVWGSPGAFGAGKIVLDVMFISTARVQHDNACSWSRLYHANFLSG
jgi:Plasmid recombination enzyme